LQNWLCDAAKWRSSEQLDEKGRIVHLLELPTPTAATVLADLQYVVYNSRLPDSLSGWDKGSIMFGSQCESFNATAHHDRNVGAKSLDSHGGNPCCNNLLWLIRVADAELMPAVLQLAIAQLVKQEPMPDEDMPVYQVHQECCTTTGSGGCDH
jgi:hypothetical protein